MKWWLNRDNCRGLTDRDAFRSLSIRSGIWSRGMLALSLAVFPRGKNVTWIDFSTRRSNYTAQGCRDAIKVNPFSRTHDISGEIDIPIPRASIKRHRHDLWTRVPQTHNIPIPYHGTGGRVYRSRKNVGRVESTYFLQILTLSINNFLNNSFHST